MNVYHRYEKLPESALYSVTAIGNFDGVHSGHQKVLKNAQKIAEKEGLPFNVLTFEPHPVSFFKSQYENFKIKSLRQKVEAFSDFGVSNLIIMHFNEAFSEISATSFVENILVDNLKIKYLVAGKGYRFGHNRSGDTDTLSNEGKKLGFTFIEIEPLMIKDECISSSAIRALISEGEIKKANELLGKPFEIEGFCHLSQYGNLDMFCVNTFRKYVMPRKGIYASKVAISGDKTNVWYDSVTEFGNQDFFAEEQNLLFGTHIIDRHPDFQGKRIKVRLYDFLRPEVKTDNVANWADNLNVDIHWSKIILERNEHPKMPLFAIKKP